MGRRNVIQLHNREIKTNKQKDNIYTNGKDNNYPERIERVVNNSVTAKSAANKLAAYVYGKGFTENPKVNKVKNLRLNDILGLIIGDEKYHKGFYLHINYDISGNVNYLDVLPYKNCRISKEDAIGYKGAIYYSENWNDAGFSYSIKSKKSKWFYPYNPNIDVINAQRKKDASKQLSENDTLEDRSKKLVENYKGQVLFVNLEPKYIYPHAYIDAAYNDADSEYQSSIYKNGNLRSGFLDKMVAMIEETESDKEFQEVQNKLSSLLGVENTGNIALFETELGDDGKLLPVVELQQVKSVINDKLFAYTEESVRESILVAYGIHPSLVIPSKSLFGENLQQMKEEFNNNTFYERKVIEDAITTVLGKDYNIIPLIDINNG